ncbi:MAG: T9SS type A sorting domain-containing protein, partial [Bacteroidetes bacterium]|nr:T9SS type A sorting domain-containing protein [Bacteroidota bacterium]
TFCSLYFRVQGRKTNTPILYNVYRDGVLIKEHITDLKYTDILEGVDATKQHTWGVKIVCPDGIGVSAPVLLSLSKCKDTIPISVNEKEISSFKIFPNPASREITIESEGNLMMNTIEVINFLGQTVITRPVTGSSVKLDVSNLNNGVYFVRVASEKGTSIKKFVKQ